MTGCWGHRRIGTRTCQIRRAYRCEQVIGFAGQDGARLVGSQGRTVQDLSAHKRISMRLVGLQGRTVRGLSGS